MEGDVIICGGSVIIWSTFYHLGWECYHLGVDDNICDYNIHILSSRDSYLPHKRGTILFAGWILSSGIGLLSCVAAVIYSGDLF